MSKKNMKRVHVESHEAQVSDEEARNKLKHETLLQEYLDLQKEFVLKKRKLRALMQKRDILLDEVGFLRQRHRYLTEELQSHNQEPEEDVSPQNCNEQNEIVEEPGVNKGAQESEVMEKVCQQEKDTARR